jgi:hypothetical protein
MDAASWGVELGDARKRLTKCSDFRRLKERGHELKDGAILTSVSDTPLEMSAKCIRCGGVFWFENLAWRAGGVAQWRLNEPSREHLADECHPRTVVSAHA